MFDDMDGGFLIYQSEEMKSLLIGFRFKDSTTFKQVLRTNVNLTNLVVKIKASGKIRVIATCAYQGCLLRVGASLCSNVYSFEVRKLDSTYMCLGGNKIGNKQATITWVSYCEKESDITPKHISNYLEITYGLSLPYMKF